MINKIFNFSIYILRYLSILKPNYLVNGKIDFGSKKSNLYFKNCLKSAKFYTEYGAGDSTILAKKYNKKFVSIETDKSFYSYLKKNIPQIKYLNIGPTKYYSIPILPIFFIKNKINQYSNYIVNIFDTFKVVPDFILIDGRFRVLTTLKIILFLKKEKNVKNITIIIDDYLGRDHYQIIGDIIKVNLIGRFGVIKYNTKTKIDLKKINVAIKKFFYDFR